MPEDVPPQGRSDQDLSDLDQTTSDADQTAADLDQTSADADQGAAEIDQVASDRDQRAADLDQADSDRSRESGASVPNWARTRRTRAQTTMQRDTAAHVRSETASVRDATAERRDRDADARDDAASARDRLAAGLDTEIDHLEKAQRTGGNGDHVGFDVRLNANYRKRAAASRALAAAHREDAARDRESARDDRDQAAADRRAAAEEFTLEGIDHLTETLRRRVGYAAIQRELERTDRTREPLVVAFVDVDGLKRVNDDQGHGAGDELLRTVADSMRQALRPYGLIMRFGGDEFVCVLAGEDLVGVRDRFDRISARIAAQFQGAAISVGLVAKDNGDSVDELITRADRAMLAAREQPLRS